MNTESKTKDLNSMSFEELQAELERRKKEQKKQAEKERKAFKMQKDTFIRDVTEAFKKHHKHLKELKHNTIDESNKLYKRMFEINGKEPKQDVVSFSLVNESQNKKIVVENQERIAFTEEASVPIQDIKDFFREKFENRSKMIYELLDTLLMKNAKGDYDPKLLTKLRKQVNEIDNERLTKAFEHLESCQTVVGTSTYLRAYEKDEKGKWKDIVLQFSAL